MISYEERTAVLERVETTRPAGVSLQTFQRSFEQICAGEEPWLPLGNFMHQFFGQYKLRRADLLCDPIVVSEHATDQQWQWAVFCAASVEYLSRKYDLSCPSWALHPRYALDEPWYYAIGAEQTRVQEKLRQTTPEEFTKRNIFCGDRTFSNKYEHEGRQGRRRSA